MADAGAKRPREVDELIDLEADDASVSEGSSTHGPKKSGRKPGAFRTQYYNELDVEIKNNRKLVECKFCFDQVESRPHLLHDHTVSSCKKIPAVNRQEASRGLAKS